MPDTHIQTIEHDGVTFAIHNTTPFHPNVIEDDEGNAFVQFNQGYVINYGSTERNIRPEKKFDIMGVFGTEYFLDTLSVGGGDAKGDEDLIRELRLLDDDLLFSLSNTDQYFYLELTTAGDSAYVSTARIAKYDGSPTANGLDFHYGLQNVNAVSYEVGGDDVTATPYSNSSQGVFRIPLCLFNKYNILTHWVLRENIHWQKIGFGSMGAANTSEGSPAPQHILANWGNYDIENEGGAGSDAQFGTNPNVRFRSLIAGEGVELTSNNQSIIITAISNDGDKVADDNDDPTGENDGNSTYRKNEQDPR